MGQKLSRKESRRRSKSSSTTTANMSESSILSVSINSSSREGRDFKYNEEGRRYHGNDEVAYILPNDDDEADRVHQQHWILKLFIKSNYLAPVTEMLEEGITVLDSGCGPATWTFEMGKNFPNSNFHGLDISFVFPENIKPANVDFLIGNIAKYIPYPDNTFDYIHQRLLIAGLTRDNWETTLQELYRVLKPGGYIELVEFDPYNIINMGPLWETLRAASEMMFNSRDIPMRICSELEDRLTKAGFVNQVIKTTKFDMNHNGKAGTLFWTGYKHAYVNLKPVMAEINSEWRESKNFEDYIDACGEEAKKYKTSGNFYSFCAQKPSE